MQIRAEGNQQNEDARSHDEMCPIYLLFGAYSGKIWPAYLRRPHSAVDSLCGATRNYSQYLPARSELSVPPLVRPAPRWWWPPWWPCPPPLASVLGFRSSTGTFFVFFSLILPFFNNVWVVSVVPNIFSLRRTHGEDMITPRAKKFRGKVLALWLSSIRAVSLWPKDR